MERKVIVIVGPTCSGKTKLSLLLAQKFTSEIISADSRQVFKYLNIGTAKPSDKELDSVKHHFINYLDPDEEFNVSKFEIEAISLINNLFLHKKIPIVVGGSGLYIKALIDGIFNSVDTDEEFRLDLKQKMDAMGKEYLYEQLQKVDAQSAEKMLPQNWKRVMRALEVFHLTGEPIWKHQNEYKRELDFEFIQVGLNWKRDILYTNINDRVEKMIAIGLVDEVKKVFALGYSKKLNSLNTVGYKEIISFINNEISLAGAIELIKRNTRRFAKRQMTWFRKDERIKWFDVNSENDIPEISNVLVKFFN
ncbi:MAG: tRNA (adenosine(37)-N6)-dimethylallyltransferase MiaA [Ignavibacteriales bacterium]|nr:tRNA (adenosine(37)-N6)-dimethylallyltransferase MiaA [Ignavibacteriales bacterium]